MKAKAVIVGSNFQFGKKRSGNIEYLSSVLPRKGIEIIVVDDVMLHNVPVSSTRIRKLLSLGRIDEVNELLGRCFTLRGVVVEGRKVGRAIGYPTANIKTNEKQLIPAFGVYVCKVYIDGLMYTGVCNIGIKPTFEEKEVSIEVYIINYSGDLYGSQLDVSFIGRIREEKKFAGIDELKFQIEKDIKKAILFNESCSISHIEKSRK